MNGISGDTIPTDNSMNLDQTGLEDAAGSPADSLFNGNDNDSLFGDNDDNDANALFGGGNEDVDFSKVIANDMDAEANPETNGNVGTANESSGDIMQQTVVGEPSTLPMSNGVPHDISEARVDVQDSIMTNGVEDSNAAPVEQNIAPEAASTELPQDESIFLAASRDGSIRLWDKRQQQPAAKIVPRNVPPWCMSACWSPDGNSIYAGRRNGTVEEFSLHKGLQGAERSFKLPPDSGAVSAVHCMPNGRHLVCASFDILRLYDLQQQQMFKHSTVPFLIIPGHRTGVVSQLYIDPSCRYLITTGGHRGWEGMSTEVLLGYEIHVGK